MRIKELTAQEFDSYARNNPLRSYMQSAEYAELMIEKHYNYEFIGLVNDQNVIVAASLILWKKISLNLKYGYAPKGFLINYYDEKLLSTFVEKIKEYYSKKGISFIKINPEIVVGEVDTKDFSIKETPNIKLKQNIQRFGFIKLKDNLYFESLTPRFNAYIDLKNSKFSDYSKPNRNKINNSKRKGLYITKGTLNDIDGYYRMIKTNKSMSYFKTLYNLYNKNNKIDLILVKVDYETFIKNSQNLYEEELNTNTLYNEILHRRHRTNDLNKKMASDSKLCIIKNEIVLATEGLRNSNNEIVAGAIVIKDGNRAHIISSYYDKKHSHLNANYFLYDAIINMYKQDFDYLDLNGITGDFKKTNPYKGLNKFKLGFNPKIYEYIGEYDLVINKINYEYLLNTGKLASEFNKK